ncbi:MAG: Holliday junction branch migration protein RuvA [Candidatus Kuenenia sp.]|nr:Holliday junction branch migration protein RuvA [Candidatus Kuenenia hertensis]
MLEYIRGQVISKSPTKLVLEVAGVGYLLHIPLSTFEKIPSHGEVKIHTQLFLREEGIKLFGFASEEEKGLFQLLLSVNGVGPTMAVAILSGSTVNDIKSAIAREDIKSLTRIKGVGKKTAERIVLELKEDIKEIKTSMDFEMDGKQNTFVSDAVMALISLGYGRPVAESAVNEAVKKLKTVDNIEILIREALKYKT